MFHLTKYNDFKYVDFRASSGRWERVPLNHIPTRVSQANHEDCYHTVQQFRDGKDLRELTKKLYTENIDEKNEDYQADREIHYAPFYFDVDIPSDDLREHPDQMEEFWTKLKEDVYAIANFFLSLGVEQEHLRFFFSGKRGVHIFVHPEALGIAPHAYLTEIFKYAVRRMAHQFNLSFVDLKVYSKRRLLRIPNTKHPKTGLYKIELSFQELSAKTFDDVCAMAHNHRPLFYDEEVGEVEPSDSAVKWFKSARVMVEKLYDNERLRQKELIKLRPNNSARPSCIKDLLHTGVKGRGIRNITLLNLAAFFSSAGINQDETIKQLCKWTIKVNQQCPASEDECKARMAEVYAVTRTVFENKDRYRFSCNLIKSVGGEFGAVACDGTECKCMPNGGQELEKELEVDIYSINNPAFFNHRITCEVSINQPAAADIYHLVSCYEVTCNSTADTGLCRNCRLFLEAENGVRAKTVEFKPSDPRVMRFLGLGEDKARRERKTVLGIPSRCVHNGLRTKIIKRVAVANVTLTPFLPDDPAELERRAQLTNPFLHEEHAKAPEDEFTETINTSALLNITRQGYIFDFKTIEDNEPYIARGYVRTEERTGNGVFVIETIEKKAEGLNTFVMTPKLGEMLSIFQAKVGEEWNKLEEIEKDFERNVHKIEGRTLESAAISLTYCSPLKFRFLGSDLKGCLETWVIGDSANGKTSMIRRLMNHYKLGTFLGGEDTSKTGLTYTLVKRDKDGDYAVHYGIIPKNDRKLLAIDEFRSIKEEEFRSLKTIRSDGRLDGCRVSKQINAWCRVRFIFIGNPPAAQYSNDNRVKSHRYPADIFNIIFDRGSIQEIIRRVDIPMVTSTSESKQEKDFFKVSLSHKYLNVLCKNLVFWIWTRSSSQIKFDKGIEEMIVEQSNDLQQRYRCDLEFIGGTDFPQKLAKLSVAIAARLFSTDDKFQDILVKSNHVLCAVKFLDLVYKKMRLDEYSRDFINANLDTPELRSNFKKKMIEQWGNDSESIAKRLLAIDVFSTNELSAFFNMDYNRAGMVFAFMLEHGVIEKAATRGGGRLFRKTQGFTEFLRTYKDVEVYGKIKPAEKTSKVLPIKPLAVNSSLHEEGDF